MSLISRRARLLALSLIATLFLVLDRGVAGATARATTHDWCGRWALVGHDFPDGDRHAIAVVTRLETGALTLRFEQGPPGVLLGIDGDADSLHVDWLIAAPERGEPMEVHLATRGANGDSVTGHWEMREGHVGGAIEGYRLR